MSGAGNTLWHRIYLFDRKAIQKGRKVNFTLGGIKYLAEVGPDWITFHEVDSGVKVFTIEVLDQGEIVTQPIHHHGTSYPAELLELVEDLAEVFAGG